MSAGKALNQIKRTNLETPNTSGHERKKSGRLPGQKICSKSLLSLCVNHYFDNDFPKLL